MPAHARVPFSAAAAVLAASTALAAACGVPPELRDPPGSVVPSPQTAPPTAASPTAASPSVVPADPPTVPGTTPTFAEAQAVACNGKPGGAQVISLLRRTSGLLPSGATATVRADTPLCAGTWQYSVVTVSGRDPLAVVTKGSPNALTLVTAGTNVCNIPVRTSAPVGIRDIACERGPAPGTV